MESESWPGFLGRGTVRDCGFVESTEVALLFCQPAVPPSLNPDSDIPSIHSFSIRGVFGLVFGFTKLDLIRGQQKNSEVPASDLKVDRPICNLQARKVKVGGSPFRPTP